LLGAALTCVAFWTTRIWALGEFYWALVVLFSGQFVPMELMPKVVQEIARYLPFGMTKYYPIQIILGRISTQETIHAFTVGLVWLVIAYLLFSFTWRQGIKQYSAVGA